MSSRAQQTRVKILESAHRLLVERGYHGVGLEEVARDAGVSRQAVYLHFKSKADLLVAMAQHNDQVVGVPEILGPARQAQTALEALDAGVAAYGEIEPQIYDVARIIYSARRSSEAAESAWQDKMAFRRENIRQSMERLQGEGLLADGWTVDEASDFVWALLSLHTYEYLVVERGWPIERFVSRLQTILRSVLAAQPDDGGYLFPEKQAG
jgi:AcrR family transcriptional regulator